MSRGFYVASVGWLLIAVVLASCARLGPQSPVTELQAFTLSALDGVVFHPPLGGAVDLDGSFDPDINLHIEVFNLVSGESVAAFSVGGGEVAVTFDPGVEEHYQVNWHTRSAGLPNGALVRVEVRLSHAPKGAPACDGGADLLQGCLAFTEVQLLANPGQGRGGSASRYVRWRNGQTIPIKVHVREGVAANGYVGPFGGVVIGDDGVVLRAEAGEVDEVLAVDISRTAAPETALDDKVESFGAPYRLAPTCMDASDQAGCIGLFAGEHGFALALPVPEGVETSRLAVAILNEPWMVSNQSGSSWEYHEGQFDHQSRLFLIRLLFVPPEGITIWLVSGSTFVTRDVLSAEMDEGRSGLSASSIPTDGVWLDEFVVRPISGRPPVDASVAVAYAQALREMIAPFRGAGFPSFKLKTDANHVCPGGRITSGAATCYWDYSRATYQVHVGEYYRVQSGPDEACQIGPGGTIHGTASQNGILTACTLGTLSDGRVVEGEQDTLRHELMHTIQFRFRAVVRDANSVYRTCLFTPWCNAKEGERSGEYLWMMEGTAVLAERTLVGPDFHLSIARQPSGRPLRVVDQPLLAGPLTYSRSMPYETQDFWAYLAQGLFNSSGGDGASGFGHVMRFFERGVTPAAVNTTLDRDFGLGPNALADMYWSWSKNQAFERQVDLGDGTFERLGTCSPTRYVFDGTTRLVARPQFLAASGSQAVALTLDIEPLSSRWYEVDLSGVSQARLSIEPVSGSAGIYGKFYRNSAVDGWQDCSTARYETDRLGPGVSASLTVESAPDGLVYILIANTDSRLPAEVTVVVRPEGATPVVGIGDGQGPGFDDPGLDDMYRVLKAGLDTSDGTLKLSERTSTFPFIWIALSARGTIAKVNTSTGEILGEYRTAPSGTGTNPSRTTVGLDGSVWAGNRNSGYVVHVGLREAGQCIDRDGDGVIATSSGYGDVLPWPAGGVPADECILHLVNHVGADARHVSVNADGNIWVGSYSGANARVFQLIDSASGLIVRTEGPFACGGYGGLIDRNGVLWSASRASGVLRWDPNAPTVAGQNPRCLNVPNYGLAVDASGWIWVSSFDQRDSSVRKISPDGTSVLGPFNHGNVQAQGLAVDGQGHVWVSSSLSCYSNCTVGHLLNDGTFIGRVPAGAGSTGVAVDAEGKVWTANINASSATRIDPSAGPIGADGATPVGAVDLTVPLPGANPYNYSDMTGRIARTITTIQGTWNATIDGGTPGYKWQSVVWQLKDELPPGTGVEVKVRAADEEAALGATPYTEVVNGADLSGVVGRFLQIEIKLFTEFEGVSPEITSIRLF